MLTNFQRHRDAEIRRDLDAVIDTFVDDRYLETVALGARSERRKATRVAYESYFTAFSDLDSDYQRFAAGPDVLVGWGVLAARAVASGSVSRQPEGTSRFVSRTWQRSATAAWPARACTSIWQRCASRRASRSTRLEQPVDAVRAAAKERAAPTS
jgi:hypothetical protein